MTKYTWVDHKRNEGILKQKLNLHGTKLKKNKTNGIQHLNQMQRKWPVKVPKTINHMDQGTKEDI
jgi:hypothetical protein